MCTANASSRAASGNFSCWISGRAKHSVKGSLPLSGPYGRYAYLNWAAKFLADSLMLEIDLRPRLPREDGRINRVALAHGTF